MAFRLKSLGPQPRVGRAAQPVAFDAQDGARNFRIFANHLAEAPYIYKQPPMLYPFVGLTWVQPSFEGLLYHIAAGDGVVLAEFPTDKEVAYFTKSWQAASAAYSAVKQAGHDAWIGWTPPGGWQP